MKICVIGNSHVAAIKLAYEGTLPDPPHEMTFFAGLGRRIGKFEVAEGKLVPPVGDSKIRYAINVTSGGLSEINPALYERFLIIGMSGGVHQLVSTTGRPISKGAIACAVADYWHATPLASLLQNLRQITQKPISVGAAPLLAQETSNDITPETYSQFIDLSNALYFQDFNTELIGQPLNTIVNGDATEMKYSRMSERLIADDDTFGIHHPEGENSHMNQHYGALWLKQYYEQLAAKTKR